MQRYDTEEGYNLSSEDDSEHEGSDSEGENAYRRYDYEPGIKNQPLLIKESKPEKEGEETVDTDEETEKERINSEAAGEQVETHEGIKYEDRVEPEIVTEDQIHEMNRPANIKQGPDDGIEMKEIKVQDVAEGDDEYRVVEDLVQEWYEAEEELDTADPTRRETDMSIYKTNPIRDNTENVKSTTRSFTPLGKTLEAKLRTFLKRPEGPSLRNRFHNWMNKRRNYERIPTDEEGIELIERKPEKQSGLLGDVRKRTWYKTKEPVSSPAKKPTPFKRTGTHYRPINKAYKTTFDELRRTPITAKQYRGAGMLSLGHEANKWIADIVHYFTGQSDNDWWQPHIQSVRKYGWMFNEKPYMLKHEGHNTGVRTADRQEAENWVNMNEEGRMNWLDTYHRDNTDLDLARYKEWAETKQAEHEQTQWSHIGHDVHGKLTHQKGLPPTGSKYQIKEPFAGKYPKTVGYDDALIPIEDEGEDHGATNEKDAKEGEHSKQGEL